MADEPLTTTPELHPPPPPPEQPENPSPTTTTTAAAETSHKTPLSVASFKVESNRTSDLTPSQRNALNDFKQLLQEALNNHLFTSPPPPPQTIENPPPQPPVVAEEAETEGEATKSATIMEHLSIRQALEKSDEVSIWGIPLLADERSDVILLKFLRARDFKVKEAFTMLKNTIQWRKAFGIEALVQEDLRIGEDLEKVVFMHGFDRERHPICYNVYGEFQNKDLYEKVFSDSEKRSNFLRWRIQFLERSIRKLDFSPGGVNTIFQVNDLKNSPGPAKRELRQATRLALHLLQDNYPEFVAKQVFINVPWWYLAFYTIINPFLTQRTKSKFVISGPTQTAETLFKYVSPEQVPVQYGGLSVDYCECNPEFSIADPVTEITIKPATKQSVEILISEKCTIVWETRVVGWEVSYSAEFVPNAKDSYTLIIQKARRMGPTDEPVVSSSFKVSELGKIVLTIDNPTSKKKKLLYRYNVKPFLN